MQKTYVWVKASERLPASVIDLRLIARYIKSQTIVYDFQEFVKQQPQNLHLVEWLSEESGYRQGWVSVEELRRIRNHLYEQVPTGETDAFSVLAAIGRHLKYVDNIIDSLPSAPGENSDEKVK